MRIEVICTGDEVLTGKIVNSNFAYIAQKLEDFGFSVFREVTVGDDREMLLRAFAQAGEDADAVIVNGGLGPTVDDLSQEVAAQAAGVGLVLHPDWLAQMEAFFSRRGRVMPENNKKQAMLPQGAEMLDNPIGTACGFAMDIGKARFFFTPGVPRELFRMLEEEILPRLLQKSGTQGIIHLKRFHSFGLGESHVDHMLKGIEDMVPDGSLKLGFRAHYPQLETKLTVRARDESDAMAKLAPVEAEIRALLGNFILGEDDQILEEVILNELSRQGASVAIVEDFTGGQIAARLAPRPGAEALFRNGTVSRDINRLCANLGVDHDPNAPYPSYSLELAEALAVAARDRAGATHGLAVLVELEEAEQEQAFGGGIHLAVVGADKTEARRSRLAGGREWVRLGATELGLDSLRRFLQGRPVTEKTDFERAAAEKGRS